MSSILSFLFVAGFPTEVDGGFEDVQAAEDMVEWLCFVCGTYTLALLILPVVRPQYAHFGCVAPQKHMFFCGTHVETYMYCTFCGTTCLYIYGCYVNLSNRL